MANLTAAEIADPTTDNTVFPKIDVKHPRRSQPGTTPLPSKEEVLKERRKVDPFDPPMDYNVGNGVFLSSLMEELDSLCVDVSIETESIYESVAKIQRSKAGGLQQITPWLLRRAVQHSRDGSCAKVMARLATRWGLGHFSLLCGELMAAARMIGLWKKDKDVRPIAIGSALRRIISKAHMLGIVPKIRKTLGDQLKGKKEFTRHALSLNRPC